MNETFVDTSGIVALLFRRDARHAPARTAWKGLLARRSPLVTTELVVAESVTLARSRAGHDLSVRLGERLLAEPFEIVWTTRPLLEVAWSIYRKYSDQVLSLYDCVSFAVMRSRRIRTAFTYDADFEHAGFERVL